MYSVRKIKRLAGPFFLLAITHWAYKKERPGSRGCSHEEFRQLAWLGDAFLHLTSTEYLLNPSNSKRINTTRCSLEKWRDRIEMRKTHYAVACQLGLDKLLRTATSQPWHTLDSFISESIEVLIAVIYRHSGRDAAHEFIVKNIIEPVLDGEIFTDTPISVDARNNDSRASLYQHGFPKSSVVLEETGTYIFVEYSNRNRKCSRHHPFCSHRVLCEKKLKLDGSVKTLLSWEVCKICGTQGAVPQNISAALEFWNSKHKKKTWLANAHFSEDA